MSKIQQIKKYLEEVTTGKKAVLLFTGDKGSTLLINIINNINMNVKIIFIDTGYHFDEIMDYLKKLPHEIEIIKNNNATIDSSVDMNKCCRQRKAEILKSYLSDIKADCLILPFIDEEKKYGVENSYLEGIEGIEIIRPLSKLTERDIWISIKENKLPFSKIYNKGYKIVDCKCCTTRMGRRMLQKEVSSSKFDSETIEKLKSLGYM
jgi:phosphoadenosine phosphosulfate reductase